jgi:hypothetical protein
MAAPPPDRAVDVLKPVPIYRVVGRRPSDIYIDGARKPTLASTAPDRLSDLVYRRSAAQPGDQIQERRGGTVLVTAENEHYKIRLTPPAPLTLETAYAHGELAIEADHREIARLVTAGDLVEATVPRPLKGVSSRLSDRIFAEGHPLVIDGDKRAGAAARQTAAAQVDFALE